MARGRGRRRTAELLAICVLVCTSCVSVTVGQPAPTSSPSPTPAASPTASPTPDADEHCSTPLSEYELDVRRTGDVSASDERAVAAALHLAQDYYDVQVPECEPGDVEASVLDHENERFAAGTVVTGAPHFRIEVYAGGEAWAHTPRSQIPIIMLHEWYHVLQYSFLSCTPPRCHAQVRDIPEWLIEGGAEYAAAQAAQDRRLLFYSFIRRYELFRAGQVDTPLERIKEARTSADYGLAFAAVELLVSQAGRDSLLDFWEQAGATGRWESVFPDVFGTTPAKFYREFAAYRAAGFRR